MPRIPFSNNPIHVGSPRGPFHFFPKGKVSYVSGPRLNPALERFKVTWAARIIVGLSVKGRKVQYKAASVIKYVKAYCLKNNLDPSSSYVSQKGMYRHKVDNSIITENSLQVIILNLNDLSPKDFQTLMETLGERLAEEYRQETTIVEMQRNAVVKETIIMGPREMEGTSASRGGAI
jgi:hypothetical protein